MTATLDPVEEGLGEGLATPEDGFEPPHAASITNAAIKPTDRGVPCTHPDTGAGYTASHYSGVTYAAVSPPSTRNVAPLT